MEESDLLVRFFRAIGAEREAEMYFRLFKRTEPGRFAVLEVAPDLSPLSLGILAPQIAFLVEIDLIPVILHGPPPGGGDEETEAWTETILSALRIGDVEAEEVAADLEDGVLSKKVCRKIKSLARKKVVSVLAVGDLAAARGAILRGLRPFKIVRLAEPGGLRSPRGEILEYLNLSADDGLFPNVAAEDLPFVLEVGPLLYELGPRAGIQVAPPGNLLGELFLVRGTGTYVKRGRRVELHKDLAGLSRTRLRDLIEKAFGGRLARDYFRSKRREAHPIDAVLLDPDYRGVAILRRVGRLRYLDKFAVRRIAQGEGLGHDLWEEVARRFSKFFWRSRPSNPINSWYARRATGMHRGEDWTVWWVGLAPREIRAAIDFARAYPVTVLADERRTGKV